MVVLIMGASHTGKTLLAQKMMERYHFVREIIKTVIENGQNLIVEGCYTPFDWMKDFKPVYLKNIRCRCLVMSEKYIRTNFDAIRENANVIENRGGYDDCTMESVIKDNAEVLESAQKYQLPYTIIDDKYDVDAEW